MVQTSAATINYDLDEISLAKISDLIDSICAAADIINSRATVIEEAHDGNAETAC